MGRVLGKIDYGGDLPSRYFIHDDTTGVSRSRVDESPEKAWAAYDQGSGKPLEEPASADVYRVLVSIAWSRSFVEGERPLKGPYKGLATTNRLLHPHDTDQPHWLGLGLVNGAMHAVEDREFGFGSMMVPICGAKFTEDVELVEADEPTGRPLMLCCDCAATLRRRG